MKKRTFVFWTALALCLSLVLTGCGKAAETAPATEAPAAETPAAETEAPSSGDEAQETDPARVAVTVGTTAYTEAEYNIFYTMAANTIYSYYQSLYGDYASYFVDTESDEWTESVRARASQSMQLITALWDEANANGRAMTAEDTDEVETQLATLGLYATMYGYSSTDEFLTSYYGEGVTEEVYRGILEKMVVAQNYSASIEASFTYTEEEKEAWYAAHADEYDYIHYYYYYVGADNEAFADLEDGAKQAAAHVAAEQIASAADGEAFSANTAAFSEGASAVERYVQGSALSSAPDGFESWLIDGARKSGDATVIDTESGAYALLFSERDDNDYALTAFRHILVMTETDAETGEYTDAAKAAARTRIDEIYAEWQENPTEDNFAALANEYSADGGSNTTGGLYENVARRQMVANINDFLFTEGRAPGDTAVVYGESSGYQGWHIVYFVGAGENYRDSIAGKEMKAEAYNAYVDALVENYPVSEVSEVS